MNRLIYLSPERRPAPHGPFAFGGEYEHDYCCQVAQLEKELLAQSGFRVVIGPPEMAIADRARQANRLGADLYQTIHTNAGGGTGAEMLAFQHPEAIRASRLVYKELVKLYPSTRGLKNGDAYLENNSTQMVSVYPELAFHDNREDARFLVSHRRELAEALACGICRYFGVELAGDVGGKRLYRVQAGAFGVKENAESLAHRMKQAGFEAVVAEGGG